MAQEHNEHTIHQERLLNALLKVFGTVGRDLAVTGGEERGMLEEGVQMACVVFLLGREGSASEAWEDFNTTTPPIPSPSIPGKSCSCSIPPKEAAASTAPSGVCPGWALFPCACQGKR